MEEFQGGFLPYPEDARLIQIDIDPFELGRNWKPDVAIQADARQAIEAAGAGLAERSVPSNEEYVSRDHSGGGRRSRPLPPTPRMLSTVATCH
jgi:thiamine pyrophosphate-dependent acetolactate synthase large subunit-like protein